MTDLRELFKSVDRVPTPDLTDDVWARVARLVDERPVAVLQGRRIHRALAVAAGFALFLGASSLALNLLREPGGSADPAVAKADWLTTGTSMASCVEPFSVEALGSRSWAFDGVIVAIELPEDPEGGDPGDMVTSVTFRVEHWYVGGSGDTITLKTYNTPGTVTSVGGPDPSIGARILASGEDEYIWSCGFSKEYAAENTAIFQEAFGS